MRGIRPQAANTQKNQTTSGKPQSPKPLTGRAKVNAALLLAALEDNPLAALRAIEAGADVNTQDAQGRTPLLCAIEGRPAKSAIEEMKLSIAAMGASDYISPVVKMLLAQKAHVNTVDKSGRTALIIAIAKGQTRLCSELIQRKANVNYCDKDGTSPLMLAAYSRHSEIVELLLKAGAEVKRHGMTGKVPLLAFAVLRPTPKKDEEDSIGSLALSLTTTLLGIDGSGDVAGEEIFLKLLKAGADPNETTANGEVPLMFASYWGSPRTVRILLSQRANIEAAQKDGTTALFWAAAAGRGDNGKILLDAGANPNVVSQDGMTALMYAAESGCYALVEQLLRAGAKPDARNAKGKTAEDLAAAKRHTAIVRLIHRK
jgi:ankyrin repeat protein